MRRDPVGPVLYISPDGLQHNYLAKLLRQAENLLRLEGQPGAGGGEYHIQVLHHDWCAFFRGRACNCNPIVRRLASPPKARS